MQNLYIDDLVITEKISSKTFGNLTALETLSLPYEEIQDPDLMFERYIGLFCGSKVNMVNGMSITRSTPNRTPSFNTKFRSNILSRFEHYDDCYFINLYLDSMAKVIVKSLVKIDDNDMVKAHRIFEWTANAVPYNDADVVNGKNRCDSSVFLYDSSACDGYARGLDILMHAAGIESYLVSAPKMLHSFNIIRLANHFYVVDATNGMFLVKPDDFISAFGISPEQAPVSEWIIKVPSRLHNANDGLILTDEMRYFSGDINADGMVNNTDLTLLRSYLDETLLFTSDQRIPADLNFDGKITEADAERLSAQIAYE